MSKDRFRGHYYTQLNHQRLEAVLPLLSANEACAVLKLHVLAGTSRQRFGFADGTLSTTGQKMKKSEVADWLVSMTPRLTRSTALQVIESLKKRKLVSVRKSGVVVLCFWASEQMDNRSAGAKKTAVCRVRQEAVKASDALSLYKGQRLEIDSLMDLLMFKLKKRSRKTVSPILEQLVKDKLIVPAEGGIMLISDSFPDQYAAPSALSPPSESEGADAREGVSHMITSDEVTCNYDHNHNHKRGSNEPHDHDTRAARADEVSPKPAYAASGPGHRDGFADDGGGRAPKARLGGTGRSADIWEVHHRHLPETACRILGATDFKKTAGILRAKLSKLTEHCGPDQAQETFRMLVQAVNTELQCGGRLRQPERELCARLNEAMGLPRRGNGKAVRS